ncbi:MAG TPA: hypothetical protein VIH57_03690 [Bacteroidales bacterium]
MNSKVLIAPVYNDLNYNNLPAWYSPFVFFHKVSTTDKHLDLMIKIKPFDKVANEVDVRWEGDADNKVLVYTFTVVTSDADSDYTGYSIAYIDNIKIESPDETLLLDDTQITIRIATLPTSNDVQGQAVVRYGDIEK